MLQIHYIRVSARLVLLTWLALVALVACSSGGDEPLVEKSSSSEGNPPVISSSSGGSAPGISSSSEGSVPGTSSSSSSEANPPASSSSGESTPGSSSSSSGTANPPASSSSAGSVIGSDWPFDSSNETLTPTSGLEGLNIQNRIDITYNNGSAPTIKNDFSGKVEITQTGENIVVRVPDSTYSFVLSGTTTNGSIRFYGDVRKKLYLNGLNITNNSGSAINIQKSGRIIVHLVNGTQNFLADAQGYKCTDFTEAEEQAKGAFFSEGKLEFEGSGSLEVKGKCNHAIVADNDFEVRNGKIIIRESVGDGIHANDKIEIKGGVLEISSVGDAIQSEYDLVSITGGKIKAKTTGPKSHGIVSEGVFTIDPGTGTNAIVQISVFGNGSKGIKSTNHIKYYGGKISIKVSGTKHPNPSPTDPTDESTPSGIKGAEDLYIEGGELTIKSPGIGAKGISVDNDVTISAGSVDIDADDDGIKVKRNLKISGGTVKVKSAKKPAMEVLGSYSKTGGDVSLTNGN